MPKRLGGAACGVLENPPLTLQGCIFFVRTPNWVILDPLKILRDVEPIHIILKVMGGYGTTQKFIFFDPYYALFASKCT